MPQVYAQVQDGSLRGGARRISLLLCLRFAHEYLSPPAGLRACPPWQGRQGRGRTPFFLSFVGGTSLRVPHPLRPMNLVRMEESGGAAKGGMPPFENVS